HRPALVKMVKITSFDSSPVVNRHVESLQLRVLYPGPTDGVRFASLSIPITPVRSPELVRPGVERPACFLLRQSLRSRPIHHSHEWVNGRACYGRCTSYVFRQRWRTNKASERTVLRDSELGESQ